MPVAHNPFFQLSSPALRRFLAAPAAFLLLSTALVAGALEDYVNAPDPHYAWKRCELDRKRPGLGVTHLEMISQHWRGQFWSHHLLVVRPDNVTSPHIALLFVTGGGYGSIGDKEVDLLSQVARESGAIVAIVNKIPNQPLYDGRTEDALIAHTFDQYRKDGDATWPLLFPMVKSAVRAMDTVQEFARQEWKQEVKEFVVSGASKRGWTTWLTGATDRRVKAIAPMVIDVLNFKAQMEWSQKMYGRQSEEIDDYTKLDLHLELDTPAMRWLRANVDPYSYRERYTMPKLVLLGTNDPYWVVDSLRHYWADLPGPKLIFQTPNAGHDLAGGKEAVNTLAAFFTAIARGTPLPGLTWTLRDGTGGPAGLSFSANQPVRASRIWTAHSKGRDFREAKWASRDLGASAPNASVNVDVPVPKEGFTAFMAEVELTGPAGTPYKLSTQVQVVPDLVNTNP